MARRVVILGGGVSGKAAEALALALGDLPVIVSDGEGAELAPADLYVASPGVKPLVSPLYRAALASNVELISELEYGFRHLKTPVLGITGTNGKTTTTELTTFLLNRLGIRARYAGNIGVPLAQLAAEGVASGTCGADVVVVEVSSFQLERSPEFAPKAAVLLNLESDHEDRYAGGFAEYCEVKRRIFARVPVEDRIYGLSFSETAHRVTADGTHLYLDEKPLLKLASTHLAAPHNVENLAAAMELVLRMFRGKPFPAAEFALAATEFRPGRHRIEFVGEKRGVKFINDSKGTNPAAVVAAVNAVPGQVVLLLGGLDKGMDFAPLAALAPRLRSAVVFGQCRARIAAVLQSAGVKIADGGMDFPSAVNQAYALAEPGDTVMLSPACASMDMFKNYEERGNAFCELVQAL